MSRRKHRPAGHALFPGFDRVVEIGLGSVATVYRAREQATGRTVALKLLNIRDASPRALESFERESLALGALSSHPNIVTLYRTLRTPDGRPVLVLEYCRGAVADRVRYGAKIPPAEAVAIGIKIAAALETAHRGGILHRDVKPQNILLTEFGEPALADFGVAMLQSSTKTSAGLFDFTTLHAAPELLEGGTSSAATDVYELASTLYQLVAGRAAFRAFEGESPASVILRILRDPVLPIADVPPVLSDVLLRAMSKDRDDRPPTAGEFAQGLAHVEAAQGWVRTQFAVRTGSLAVEPDFFGRSVTPTVGRVPDNLAGPGPLPAPASAPAPAAAPAPARAPGPTPVPSPWPPARAEAATTAQAAPTAPVEPRAPVAPAVQRRVVDIGGDDEIEGTTTAVPAPLAAQSAAATAGAPSSVAVTPRRLPGETEIDPMSLEPTLVVRSGFDVLRVNENELIMRVGMQRDRVPWSAVVSIEPYLNGDPVLRGATGVLVVRTATGAFELPATERPVAELPSLHALLLAYRRRAQLLRG